MDSIRNLARPFLSRLAAEGVGADRAYRILREQFGPGYTRDQVRQDIGTFRSAAQQAQFSRFAGQRGFVPDSSHVQYPGIQQNRYRYVFQFPRRDSSGNEMKPLYVQVGTNRRMRLSEITATAIEFTQQSPNLTQNENLDAGELTAQWINNDIELEV